ncbi:MAG TPA: hypothetical protein VFP42_14565 [Acidimicrobiia bacterium]|nr:hypothetical protein [Acidimicrobiia bacterium]
MRRMFVVLIAMALAIGVFVFWPRSDGDDPPVTIAEATTTTTQARTTTTSAPPSTTTSDDGTHVVETEAEAEEILRELWFGWFEGIYNQDENRIREVVATQQMLDAAKSAFGGSFSSAPTRNGIDLDLEILRSDSDCLVVYGTLDVGAFRGPDAESTTVQVLRNVDESWRFATSWIHPEDLWEADCDADLLPLS